MPGSAPLAVRSTKPPPEEKPASVRWICGSVRPTAFDEIDQVVVELALVGAVAVHGAAAAMAAQADGVDRAAGSL